MSVPLPQIDYPRGSLPRGGSDIWDTPQASVVLADDMFASAGPAPTVLTGNNVASTATSTQGAISQTHALTGAASSQANASTTGAVSQSHTLTGANSAQANTSATGAVTQTHILTGSDCQQANASTTGAVGQTHILSGVGCQSANHSTSDAVIQTHVLGGGYCVQPDTCMGGKIGIDYRFKTLGAELRHTCPGSKLHGLNFGRSLTAPVLCSRLSAPSAAHTVKPVNCSTTLTTSDKKTLLTRYNP